jgi:hypothetical protein
MFMLEVTELFRVPGKDVISSISQVCQEKWKFSISCNSIISNISKKMVPDELIDFFTKMKLFVDNELIASNSELTDD